MWVAMTTATRGVLRHVGWRTSPGRTSLNDLSRTMRGMSTDRGGTRTNSYCADHQISPRPKPLTMFSRSSGVNLVCGRAWALGITFACPRMLVGVVRPV